MQNVRRVMLHSVTHFRPSSSPSFASLFFHNHPLYSPPSPPNLIPLLAPHLPYIYARRRCIRFSRYCLPSCKYLAAKVAYFRPTFRITVYLNRATARATRLINSLSIYTQNMGLAIFANNYLLSLTLFVFRFYVRTLCKCIIVTCRCGIGSLIHVNI